MIEQLENILPTLKDEHQKKSLINAIEIGVPSMKNEEWKYTYFNKIIQQVDTNQLVHPNYNISLNTEYLPFIENNSVSENRLVFVDGIFHNELSNLKNHPKINFWNNNNSTESNTNDFLLELNNALTSDGIFLEIGDFVILDELIEIFYIHTKPKQIINLKNKIQIGKNSQVKFAEYFYNLDESTTYNNIVTALDIADSSTVEWYKIQDGGIGYSITDNMQVHQTQKSVCNVTTLSFTGSIIRNVLTFHINGERAESHMNGLSILLNDEHVDNRTLVNHNVANCESFELYKNILGGSSDRKSVV